MEKYEVKAEQMPGNTGPFLTGLYQTVIYYVGDDPTMDRSGAVHDKDVSYGEAARLAKELEVELNT
jgi:hypothetical protein